jgi:hypothetical protein
MHKKNVNFEDLTNYLDTFIHFRFGHLGLFLAVYLALPSPVLAFIHFYNYYAFSAQNVATVFLALNRFTALFRPSEHDKVTIKIQ